jgi:hypothetical protein
VEAILEDARQSARFEITERHMAHLPEPVQRYLRLAGISGKPNVRTVYLRQQGLFRMKPEQRWLPFTAGQHFGTNAPAFVWDAKIQLLPLVSVSVTDLFFRGHGRLQAKLLSLVPVADARGPEVDQGEMLRYLAEMAWFPTAWVSPYLEWESHDIYSANVTLLSSGLAVSAVLHFDEAGQLCRVAAQRYMESGGRFFLHDWSGEFSDYRDFAGLLVPSKASVIWHLPSGDFTYFRGEVTHLDYGL